MPTDLHRTIVALAAALCIGIPAGVYAFDVNDLIGDPGLQSSDYQAACKNARVDAMISAAQNGYVEQAIKDTIDDLKNSWKSYMFQYLMCIARNIKVTGSGTDALGCATSLGGDVKAQIQRQALNKLKYDFLDSCVSDSMRKNAGDDIRRITQENGPEGGAAYITDWINDVYVDPDQRAINRFSAVLVNTDICEDFRDQVYGYYGVPQSYIDNPLPLTGLGLRVDGDSSFNQLAACTRPAGLTPEKLDQNFTANGGFEALEVLMEPQNNFTGFVQMANAELSYQRSIAVAAAEARAIAGGGFTGTYAECAKDPNGKCIADGLVQQPAGGLRDANAAAVQAEFAAINDPKKVGDVRLRLVSMILDMQGDALSYDVELGSEAQNYRDVGDGVKQPEAIPIPPPPEGSGGTDPNDPVCTGGSPDCICVRNDPAYESIRQLVRQATLAAIEQHPELLTPDRASVLPGQNQVFLVAVCETSIGQSLACHPNGGSDDEIVIDAGVGSVSVDIITASGVIRLPGQTIAACAPGIQ